MSVGESCGVCAAKQFVGVHDHTHLPPQRLPPLPAPMAVVQRGLDWSAQVRTTSLHVCVCVCIVCVLCVVCMCVQQSPLCSATSIDANDPVDDEVCDNTTHTQSEIITLMLSFALH